jgi:Flp pilus assembly protein TadB
MWLPRYIYESIPFYYVVIGASLIAAMFYVDIWYWPEICAGAGVAFLVLGLVLLLRRKGYRASRSRLDFDRT